MSQVTGRFGLSLVSVLVATLGLFAFSSSANAAQAIDSAPMASDGVRYFAYLTPQRTPAVLDTWTGRTNLIGGAKRCQPIDVGGGRVLLTCGKADKDHMRTTKTASARGGKARLLPNNKSGFWNSIGKYWVEGGVPCTGTGGCLGGRNYVNWRSGKLGRPGGEITDWSVADLDRPRLLYISPEFIPAGFANSWKLCWDEDVMVTDTGKVRYWPTRDQSIVLGTGDNLKSGCNSFGGLRIGSGRITWHRGRVVHEYNTKTGMSYKRRLQKTALIAPVRDGAVIATKTRDGTHDRYRVRFVSLG